VLRVGVQVFSWILKLCNEVDIQLKLSDECNILEKTRIKSAVSQVLIDDICTVGR